MAIFVRLCHADTSSSCEDDWRHSTYLFIYEHEFENLSFLIFSSDSGRARPDA